MTMHSDFIAQYDTSTSAYIDALVTGGRMSFDDACKYVREYMKLQRKTETMRRVISTSMTVTILLKD